MDVMKRCVFDDIFITFVQTEKIKLPDYEEKIA